MLDGTDLAEGHHPARSNLTRAGVLHHPGELDGGKMHQIFRSVSADSGAKLVDQPDARPACEGRNANVSECAAGEMVSGRPCKPTDDSVQQPDRVKVEPALR